MLASRPSLPPRAVMRSEWHEPVAPAQGLSPRAEDVRSLNNLAGLLSQHSDAKLLCLRRRYLRHGGGRCGGCEGLLT